MSIKTPGLPPSSLAPRPNVGEPVVIIGQGEFEQRLYERDIIEDPRYIADQHGTPDYVLAQADAQATLAIEQLHELSGELIRPMRVRFLRRVIKALQISLHRHERTVDAGATREADPHDATTAGGAG